MKNHSFYIVMAGIVSLFIGSVSKGQEYVIDLGSPNYQTTTNDQKVWNNLTIATTGAGLSNLLSSDGKPSKLSLKLADGFWHGGTNTADAVAAGTTGDPMYPASATRDAFLLGSKSGITDSNAVVSISGLSSNATYNLRLYASRMSTDAVDRTTLYTVSGQSKKLQVLNNVTNFVEFPGLSAPTGKLSVSVRPAPGAAYGYLGVIQLFDSKIKQLSCDAGWDRSITLPQNYLTLNGSSWHVNGPIIKWTWQQVSGPSIATMVNQTQPSCQISGLIQGIYVFKLTVVDIFGATASDDVTVTVNPYVPGTGTNSVSN